MRRLFIAGSVILLLLLNTLILIGPMMLIALLKLVLPGKAYFGTVGALARLAVHRERDGALQRIAARAGGPDRADRSAAVERLAGLPGQALVAAVALAVAPPVSRGWRRCIAPGSPR